MAVLTGCCFIIEHLGIEKGFLTMRLLPSEKLGTYKPEPILAAAINDVKGNIIIKDLEDTIGISISFPKEGVADD